jgi:hypothetical protein
MPMFTDNIDGNLEVLRGLLGGIPPESRRRAKGAAVAIEKTFNDLIKQYPKDAAVALGAAFAIFMIAERLVQQDNHNDPGPGSLIQLLN